MSIFGSIWGGIKRAARWVGEKIGLLDKEVGKSRSVDKNSQVNDIAQMSSILNSYAKVYEKSAGELEDKCISYVDDYYNKLITDLRELEELYQGINIKRLDDAKTDICRKIRGAYINPIRNRLSLDDEECRKIIKLAAGDSKALKMKAFSSKVFQEANRSLIESVKNVLQEQSNEINLRMSEYIVEKENRLQLMHKHYEVIEGQLIDGTFDKEKAQLVPLVKIVILDKALKEIED